MIPTKCPCRLPLVQVSRRNGQGRHMKSRHTSLVVRRSSNFHKSDSTWELERKYSLCWQSSIQAQISSTFSCKSKDLGMAERAKFGCSIGAACRTETKRKPKSVLIHGTERICCLCSAINSIVNQSHYSICPSQFAAYPLWGSFLYKSFDTLVEVFALVQSFVIYVDDGLSRMLGAPVCNMLADPF